MVGFLWGAVYAAPLVDVEPTPEWVQDAVRVLAARGLIEGYPDGTFKGDRAASRWEVAMIVARVLAKMEQEHATFASKQDLDELRKLVLALKEELDALGVRVTNLEESTGRLDQRVTELERLKFYGSVNTIVGAQNFYNTGSPAMGNVIDYNAAVGNAIGAGATLPPTSPLGGQQWGLSVLGVMSTLDFVHGRPVTSGSTFTSTAVLGVEARLSEELRGGMELKAYTSQGDQIVDAFWGVEPPYLSNPFTATGGTPNLNHTPFTQMTLDNVWVTHQPSQTRLRIGSFNETNFDRGIYSFERSPSSYHISTPFFFTGEDPGLPSFGVQLRGESEVAEDVLIRWEGMGTRLAQSLSPVTGTSYQSYAAGANAAVLFHEERGKVQLNFLHASDDSNPRQAGLIFLPNQVLNWVNPPGFFVNQFNQVGGIGSGTETRPIATLLPLDGNAGIPGLPFRGGIGPQAQDSYGVSADYTLDADNGPRFFGSWARTQYLPNKSSAYSAEGDAWRAGIEASLVPDTLELAAEYLHVDPTFDPYLLEYPAPAGIITIKFRAPYFDQLPLLYSLHDTGLLPVNRKGVRTRLRWWFADNGQIKVEYGSLSQVRPSVHDVRFSAGSLGPGLPNSDLVGFSPGFVDPFFFGLSNATYAPDASGNLFGAVLESPRGTVRELSVDGAYAFDLDEERQVKLSGIFLDYRIRRESNLRALRPGPLGLQGENENFVDVGLRGFFTRVDWDITPRFATHLSFAQIDLAGHYDSTDLGVYSPYALATGQTRFDNVDITQRIPELGFDWEIAPNTDWGIFGRFYSTEDNVPASVFAAPNLSQANLFAGPQPGAHPFSWEGWQVQSYFSVKL